MNRGICLSLAFAGAVAALVATGIAPAAAQTKKNYAYVINLASKQRMLTQMMSKEAALVALGVDAPLNLSNLQQNQESFRQILNALRYGDFELAIAGTSDPLILERLKKVEELWPIFEGTIRESLATGEVAADQLATIAALNVPLLDATDATVESYKESAARGSLFSMLNIAIDQSGRLRVLTQKMTKEFLLIAYGHEVEKNKAHLHESITHFERIVTGLVQGDHEMLLLPAPTAELQQQLKDVLQVWEGFRAPLETAIRSGEVAEDHIERVETMNLALLTEAEKVVNMLESL